MDRGPLGKHPLELVRVHPGDVGAVEPAEASLELALLVGLALDQQVTVQKAFAGPTRSASGSRARSAFASSSSVK